AVADVITELLARCVKRIGKLTKVDTELIENLLVGDREFLLLKLYQITFGETIYALLPCASADCGEISEVPLLLEQLHIEASPVEKRVYSEESRTGRDRKIQFRLPTGSDQGAVCGRSDLSNESQAELIIERCLLGNSSENESLSVEEKERIAARMQELAPLLE